MSAYPLAVPQPIDEDVVLRYRDLREFIDAARMP